MNFFLILIPQSLNSQFLNLAPYSHYDEDGVQKSDIVLRSNNEVCILMYIGTLFKDLRFCLVLALDPKVANTPPRIAAFIFNSGNGLANVKSLTFRQVSPSYSPPQHIPTFEAI